MRERPQVRPPARVGEILVGKDDRIGDLVRDDIVSIVVIERAPSTDDPTSSVADDLNDRACGHVQRDVAQIELAVNVALAWIEAEGR